MMMSRHLRRRVNFGCWRFGDFVNEDLGSTFAQIPFRLISTKMIILTSPEKLHLCHHHHHDRQRHNLVIRKTR